MRYVLAVLILPFLSMLPANGQEIPIDIVDRINAVDYIFEGTVIKSTPYKTENGKYILTSNTIEIHKVLKGDLSCGTVELVTNGGMVDDLWVEVSHSLDLRKDCTGIFLAKGTNKELSPIDFFSETNYQKLEATFENQSFIKYWYDGVEWKASDVWANFHHFAELYDFAEFITGYNFIDCAAAPLPFSPGGGGSGSPWPAVPVDVQARNERTRQILEDMQQDKARFQRADPRDDGPVVTYGLSNIAITGTNPRYVEFDVNINDDLGSKYLHFGGIRIVYDTVVFGASIGQTANFEILNGSLISDMDCYGFPVTYDLNANDFVLFTVPAPQSLCKAQVPTTPTQLFHVRMRVLDCVPSELIMEDSAFDLGPSVVLYYSSYSDTPDDPFFTEYGSAEHDQTEQLEGCGPMITNFSPTTVAGGIRQVLQIRGQGFGATRGSGTVYFKNADDGGGSEVACDANDFPLFGAWSDTLIQLFVPSVDTAIIQGVAEPDMAAGSGFFRVVTDSGVSMVSPDPITISYSVVSYQLGQPKIPAFLAPPTVAEGRFTFYVDSTLATYQDGAVIPIIRKALREWTCLTGVDWVMATESSYSNRPGPQFDSICVIKFGYLGNGTSSPLQLALATTYRTFCPPRFYAMETDVEINNYEGINWFMDTVPTNPIPVGYKDMYFALLHELGHAMNLQHVIAPSQTMHFSDNTVGAFRKIELYDDASAYGGGNWVMEESVNAFPPSCPGGVSLSNISSTSAPLCAGFYGISESHHDHNITLRPNPCTHSTFISSEEQPIRILIVRDVSGKTVLEQSSLGANTMILDLSSVMDGTYFVQAILRDGSSAVRVLIKEH